MYDDGIDAQPDGGDGIDAQPDVGGVGTDDGIDARPDSAYAQAKPPSLTPETDQAGGWFWRTKPSDWLPWNAFKGAHLATDQEYRERLDVRPALEAAETPLIPKEALPVYWYGRGVEKLSEQLPEGGFRNAAQAYAGYLKGLGGVTSSFSSPLNVGLALTPGGVPGRIVAGVFLGQAIYGTPAQWRMIQDAYARGDWQGVSQHATEMGASYLPAAAFLHFRGRIEAPRPEQEIPPTAGAGAAPAPVSPTGPIPIEAQIEGGRYAEQPGYAQVETRPTTFGIPPGAPGEVQGPGGRYNVIGEAEGGAPRGLVSQPVAETAPLVREVSPEAPTPLTSAEARARSEAAAAESEARFPGLPDWARERMQQEGIPTGRIFNDVDLANPSIREAIENDPTLTREQKDSLLTTGTLPEPAAGKIVRMPGAAAEPVPSELIPPEQMTPEMRRQWELALETQRWLRDQGLMSPEGPTGVVARPAEEERPMGTAPAVAPGRTIEDHAERAVRTVARAGHDIAKTNIARVLGHAGSRFTQSGRLRRFLPLERAVRGPAEMIRSSVAFMRHKLVEAGRAALREPWGREASQQYKGYNMMAHRLADQWGFNEHTRKAETPMLAESALSPNTSPEQSFEATRRLMKMLREDQNHRFDYRMLDWAANAITKPEKGPPKRLYTNRELAFLQNKSFTELPNKGLWQAKWLRAYDQVYHPDRRLRTIRPDGSFGQFDKTPTGQNNSFSWTTWKQMQNGVDALTGRRSPEQILKRAKTSNYYMSKLLAFQPSNHVVVDTHHASLAFGTSIPSSHTMIGKAFAAGRGGPNREFGGLYSIIHEATIQAARELGMDPKELQAMVWSYQRGYRSPDAFGRSAEGLKAVADIQQLWADAARGRITEAQAHEGTEEIANRFHGGKIPAPAYYEPGRRPGAGAPAYVGDAGYPAELPGRRGVRRPAEPGAGGYVAAAAPAYARRGKPGDLAQDTPPNPTDYPGYADSPHIPTNEGRDAAIAQTAKQGAEFVASTPGADTLQLGVNMQQIMHLIGPQMYSKPIGEVAVKELIQNALDASRSAGATMENPKTIDINIDRDARTIQVKDSGGGMTPQIVKDAFFTIGGTYKTTDPSNTSGGLGMAKMAFILGSRRIKLETVKDGLKSTVDATSDQISKGAFQILKEKTAEPNGTSVTVEIPETFVNANGETRPIEFYEYPDFMLKPLIGPVEVRLNGVQQDMGIHTKNWQLDNKFNFDWGHIDVYVDPTHTEYPNFSVHSAGLYQFQVSRWDVYGQQAEEGAIPYKFLLDVRPKVRTDNPAYPFNLQREGFRGTIQDDVDAMYNYFKRQGVEQQLLEAKDVFKDLVQLPKIDPSKNLTQEQIDKIYATPEAGAVERRLPSRKKVKSIDFGEKNIVTHFESGETQTESRQKYVEKSFKPEREVDLEKTALDVSGLDPNKPYLHNNTNADFTDIKDLPEIHAKLGNTLVQFMREWGDKVKGAYEALAKADPSGWFGGISYDKSYRGLNTVKPFKAIWFNPGNLSREALRSPEAAASETLHLFIHEITHVPQRNEGDRFTAELATNYARIRGKNIPVDRFEAMLRNIYDEHWNDIQDLNDEFQSYNTKNSAASFKSAAAVGPERPGKAEPTRKGAPGINVPGDERLREQGPAGPGRTAETDPNAGPVGEILQGQISQRSAAAAPGPEPGALRRPVRISREETDAAAAQLEATDPNIGQKTVWKALKANAPLLDHVEQALVMRELERSGAAYDSAMDAVNAATPGSRQHTVAYGAMKEAEARFERATDASYKSGTDIARALSFRAGTDQFSLARMLKELQAAGGGKPLSPDEAGRASELSKSLTDLTRQMRAHGELAQRMEDLLKEHATTQLGSTAKTPKERAATTRTFLSDAADRAKERVNKRKSEGRLYTGMDPQALYDHAVIGADLFAKGVKVFSQWSAHMLASAGEHIRPYLRDIYAKANEIFDAARANDKKLAGYKKRLKTRTEKLQEKIDNGDFTKETRAKIVMDQEAIKMRQVYDDLKNQWNKEKINRERANMPKWRRALDALTEYLRAEKLTGITTIGKIFSAAAQRPVVTALEDIAGRAATVIPPIAKIARGAPTQNPVLSSLARYPGGVAKGIMEFGKVLRGTKEPAEYTGRGPDILQYPGRAHGAIKNPIKTGEYAVGLDRATRWAKSEGLNPSNPEVAGQINEFAKQRGLAGIWMNDNLASKSFRAILSMLERQGAGGYVASRFGRILLPIVRVPTNVAIEAGRYHFGLANAAVRIGHALVKGIDNLSPQQKDLIMMNLKKGMVGAGLFALGYMYHNQFGGFYNEATARDKEKKTGLKPLEAKLFGISIPSWVAHSPLMLTLNAGATFHDMMDKKHSAGYAELAVLAGILEHVPFANELTRIDKMLRGGSEARRNIGGWIRSQVMPVIGQEIARWTDKHDANGHPIKRYPQSIMQEVELGIPGRRQTVPLSPPARPSTRLFPNPFPRSRQQQNPFRPQPSA